MTDNNAIEKWADKPTELVAQMRKTGDLHEVCRFINFVSEVRRTLDKTLDIVLPPAEEVFYEHTPKEYSGQTFESFLRATTSLSDDTITRHLRVGRMLEVVPEDVKPVIQEMGFKSQIQIANTVENGLDLNRMVVNEATGESKTGWQALADAYYPQEVALTLHEINGTQPRSQFCKWEEEDGVLYAVIDIGRIPIAQCLTYDNPETEDKAEWAWEKLKRKLDIYSRKK